MLGRVRRLMPTRYGFIVDDEGKDYFFHADQLTNCNWEKLAIEMAKSNKGPLVQFESKETPKGLRAEKVILLMEN